MEFHKLISDCLEFGAIYSVPGMNEEFSLSHLCALQCGQRRHNTAAFKGNSESANGSEMKIANSTVMTPVKVTQAFK